eukprot:scaffold388_cov380-Prasinococcus_capsulatus_cf.AAC.33
MSSLPSCLLVLLLPSLLRTAAAESVRPAVTTWVPHTFAARVTDHSVCRKATNPAAAVSMLWPDTSQNVSQEIISYYEAGSQYPHFRLFGEGSTFTRPDPSEITLKLINMGPGTTGTRSVHTFGCNLGNTQIHYGSHCAPEKGPLEGLTDLIDLHFLIHQECIAKQLREPKCRTETVLDQFRAALITIATHGVQVVADNPLVSFLPQWLELNPDLKVMMTLRNPEEWALSRIHHNRSHLTRCKNKAQQSASHLFYLDCMQVGCASLNANTRRHGIRKRQSHNTKGAGCLNQQGGDAEARNAADGYPLQGCDRHGARGELARAVPIRLRPTECRGARPVGGGDARHIHPCLGAIARLQRA